MKILFLTTHLNTGGITSYLYTLAKGLLARGHVVYIGSSGGQRINDFKALGVKTVVLPIRTKSELNINLYLSLRPLARLIQKDHIDIIHAQTRITQVMGCLLSRVAHVPYISTCHGFFKPKLARTLFPCWGRMVIAISTQVRDHLKNDFNVRGENIALVPNGIDLDVFNIIDDKKKAAIRKSYQIDQQPLIGIVARLSEVKGQDLLISAMPKILREVPHVKLLIVGEGKSEEQLKALVEKFALQDSVYFVPVVNKTAELISILNVFAMPSRQEGLGLSVLEAQALGIPVVATEVGGLPSIVKHGVSGVLVPSENVEAIAQGIIRLLKDKDYVQMLTINARQYVEREHNAIKMIEQTAQVYERLVGSHEKHSRD